MKALKIEPGDSLMLQQDATFASMQADIGGYIEPIRIGNNAYLFVDEDGKMKRLTINEVASQIANRVIVGTAFLVGDGGDDFTDVPVDLVHLAERYRLRHSQLGKRRRSGVIDMDAE